MQNGLSWQTDHTPEEVMASYVAGTGSREERDEVEEHCLRCEECRAKLAIMLRICFGDESDEEKRQLEPLYSLGIEAAALARWQFSEADAEVSPDEKASTGTNPVAPPRRPVSGHVLSGRNYRSYVTLATTFAVVMVVGIAGYWHFMASTQVEDGLAALRLVHQDNRPLEARVTGGFPYRPYERKRGNSEKGGVDRDRFNYALSELTQAVTSHPNAEARHALGRLYLMLGDFDPAEKQLTLALDGSQKDAKLHADLAALYYERSKHEDPLPLLSKAIAHYDTAIKLEPELTEAWFNRALCHEQMGQKAEAQGDWQRYLQLDSSSSWAEEARDRLKKLQERVAST